jgi:hypothetical protein
MEAHPRSMLTASGPDVVLQPIGGLRSGRTITVETLTPPAAGSDLAVMGDVVREAVGHDDHWQPVLEWTSDEP